MPPRTGFAFAAALFLVNAGCSVPGQSRSWPPPSPAKPEPSASGGSQKLVIKGYDIVYKNEKKGTAMSDHVGWGPRFDAGEWVIPYDLFTMKAAGACYVQNQFEVVYHDPSTTVIRALPDHQDNVVFIDSHEGSFRQTFDCSGGRVRVLGKTYTLKTDGWYLDEVLLHAFAATNSPQ
jgi:hypothetical protein